MEENEAIFTFFYILLCICLIYPPKEFQDLGFTLENIFSSDLGAEDIQFIRYHQKRTTLNFISHSAMPGIYFAIYNFRFKSTDDEKDNNTSTTTLYKESFNLFFWALIESCSFFYITFVPFIAFYWYQNDWKRHPISKKLHRFSNSMNGNHGNVANSISDEFRRPNILKLKINSISKVIATDNWILKVTPYSLNIAHQSDTELIVKKAETYVIAEDTADSLQIINIRVKSSRVGVKEFEIRINALDFKLLEDRVRRQIIVPPTIQFHKSLIDRFIEVFKDQVSLNPIYLPQQEILDTCFACLNKQPNIKINKQCLDINENGQNLPASDCCKDCYCRPMWCVECLATWFATRQNEYERNSWLSRKCTCPLCRAQFCILDISYLDLPSNSNQEQ